MAYEHKRPMPGLKDITDEGTSEAYHIVGKAGRRRK